jgi:hypothetical protein
MNTANLPSFAAEASLRASGGRLRCRTSRRDGEPGGADALVISAESVPGGPSTVPSGYGRECRRVPYTVCDANGCRTEYGWVCTYYPLPRAQLG